MPNTPTLFLVCFAFTFFVSAFGTDSSVFIRHIESEKRSEENVDASEETVAIDLDAIMLDVDSSSCIFNIGPQFADNIWQIVINNTNTTYGNLTSFGNAATAVDTYKCTAVTITVYPGTQAANCTFAPRQEVLTLEIGGFGTSSVSINCLQVIITPSVQPAVSIMQLTIDDSFIVAANSSAMGTLLVSNVQVLGQANVFFFYGISVVGSMVTGNFSVDLVTEISLMSTEFSGSSYSSFIAADTVSLSGCAVIQNDYPLQLRGAYIIIQNSNFTDNFCESVGALMLTGQLTSNIQITGCTFRNNIVYSTNPDGRAPAIWFSSPSTVNVSKTTFACNNASNAPTGQLPVVFESTQYSILASEITIDPTCPFTCDLGEYAYAAIVNCTACASGSAASTRNATMCTPCAMGYYARFPKSAMCEPCANGTYANSTGSPTCPSCLPGTYSGLAAENCVQCPANTYSDEVGATNCTLCNPGKVVNSVLCTACDSFTEGQGCGSLSILSYGMIAAGIVVAVLIVIVIVIMLKRGATNRHDYTPIGSD